MRQSLLGGQAAPLTRGKPSCSITNAATVFLPLFSCWGRRQRQHVWEDPSHDLEENSAPSLAGSPAWGSFWAGEGNAPWSTNGVTMALGLQPSGIGKCGVGEAASGHG